MSSKVYNAGIIGYGTSANVFHIPFLTASPSFSVHSIVQRSGDSAKEAHPGCIIYRSTDELFDDKDVDLVILCTPVETHFEMAKKALNAGKHGEKSREIDAEKVINAENRQWLWRSHSVPLVRSVTN